MNDNAASNDSSNGGIDSVTVNVVGFSDGRIGFRGFTGKGEEVAPAACAKIIIGAAMVLDANAGIHNALEAFARVLEREYGTEKAREYLLAMIAAHNSAAEKLVPTAGDILDG